MSLSTPETTRSAASLHRRFIASAGVTGTVVVAGLAIAANLLLSRDIERQGDARVADAARRGHLVVTEALAERVRDARVISISPEVIAATREGAARSRALGIVGADIRTLEKRFDGDRSLVVAPATRAYLRALLPQLDAAEMLLTEENGYNAVITERSSDFVQSDEAWWQLAWRDGLSPADAAYDSSAHQTTVSIASVVRDGDRKAGVLKLAFGVAPLVQSLSTAGAGVRIDVLDSADHVLIASDSAATGTTLRGMPSRVDESGRAVSVPADSGAERAVAFLSNAGRWRVVGHLSSRAISEPYRSTRIMLNAGVGVLLAVVLLLLVAMNRFLQRRISIPATELAEIAEKVAAGDFSEEPQHSMANDEIGRLGRAVTAMIRQLRGLAQTIASSAHETRAMSAEISASTEEMAASAGQIANTASDLSTQANSMASTIGALSQTSIALRGVAASLDRGARDGVARNASLKALALENRAGLDEGGSALGTLADDVSESASAVESLGKASQEIREFVTLVRALARQSKLLSLNAAMEAARAGEQGKGFAVVATEVRRLATMSSEAADRTGSIMKAVLAGIERSRETSERALGTTADVRNATSRASASFAEIERAVAESETWTATLERASSETTALVAEINQRIDELAGGTETFAAAMQEVAASSEEQSASTEEIAGAASALGFAAEKLSVIVGGMRIESGSPR